MSEYRHNATPSPEATGTGERAARIRSLGGLLIAIGVAAFIGGLTTWAPVEMVIFTGFVAFFVGYGSVAVWFTGSDRSKAVAPLGLGASVALFTAPIFRWGPADLLPFPIAGGATMVIIGLFLWIVEAPR